MNNSVKLSTFPNNKIEALTMLYLQSQDLSGLSPEELYDKYEETYEKIVEHHKQKNVEPPVQGI